MQINECPRGTFRVCLDGEFWRREGGALGKMKEEREREVRILPPT